MENTVVWFDIPVKNLQRAMNFYQQILALNLQKLEQAPVPTAFFPFGPGVASGALVESTEIKPGKQGSTVYLNAGKDLAVPLAKVEKSGGKVLQKKTAIGPHGYIAYVEDTEGNRIGLHSMD
jgi:uncharacterized protein